MGGATNRMGGAKSFPNPAPPSQVKILLNASGLPHFTTQWGLIGEEECFLGDSFTSQFCFDDCVIFYVQLI